MQEKLKAPDSFPCRIANITPDPLDRKERNPIEKNLQRKKGLKKEGGLR